MSCKVHGEAECVCLGARHWMDRALASEGKLDAAVESEKMMKWKLAKQDAAMVELRSRLTSCRNAISYVLGSETRLTQLGINTLNSAMYDPAVERHEPIQEDDMGFPPITTS